MRIDITEEIRGNTHLMWFLCELMGQYDKDHPEAYREWETFWSLERKGDRSSIDVEVRIGGHEVDFMSFVAWMFSATEAHAEEEALKKFEERYGEKVRELERVFDDIKSDLRAKFDLKAQE